MTGGRFDFDDGGTYCGGWEEGKAHGHGICTGPKGQGEYSGSWSHGFEVVGVYTWPSGNTYQGYWAQGKRHGLGVETKGKWMYRGEWSHGFKGRYGVRQSLCTPARYEGTWSNGLQDGYGVETYGDGGTYQGQWAGGMRHGYGVRQSVPYGMATVIRSPLRTSLASLRSEQSNGSVLHEAAAAAADSPAGTRGGFVLNFHADTELGKKKGGLFRRGSLLGSMKLRKSESKSSISSKRSSVRSDAAMSRISSSDANSTISFGDVDCDFCPVEDHVDATTTETYMGEWKNDKRNGFGISERSNGMKYEGEWANNKRHGYGCTVFPDGSKEEGKYKNNILVRGIRKQLIPIRNTKTREKVDRAIEGAQRAAAMARTKVEIANSRTAHARAKADAADQAALAARQECDIARAVARELSPDFYQPGPDYIKQRCQEGGDIKENPEEKVLEKPPSPKESPHFYRKGTTPPRSPESSPKQSHSPQPSSPEPSKKQNPSPGARLSQDKQSLAEEQVTAFVNKPSMSKAPAKELGASVSKYSGRHHVPNPSNGELHSQYHGYYVKLNTPQHPPEDREDDRGVSQSSSALVPRPSPNKWGPPKSVTKPVAKESKTEPKAKKSELAIPKNPASNDTCPSLEKEANSGPNSIMIVLVMLLNIGLAILFVHFLT
ncbi:junctophilin-1 isoform X1 [Mus musculus]|uniref:Junctophilin-1 n=1 Tax=Mus musculus TaxID=10090 RepID=JPH1_MOUSE|nr:junctophilin-1 [Mus musculus]XP_011236698.1 junctophilin-1 isoform X1 [Mus musculus]XP_011236700.1 junctophilin-1 isoform X1 [Mus musculus]Q9ET80.1 RecName: Full=Junctophilin-1; Short=JP-1; AltName: Full=Junctophilin type 1 [Mus musculus]AAI20840.1 Junctophilin 1 [Mus musculus]AAI37670.1 Junctophilin 1 [Mus musculus]BAB12043.1 junctophilin type 1 [Mus musculus]|eukprot:NP_065629.1 junctophilin-1 [Mus musculus]